jgi:hypothetical protein
MTCFFNGLSFVWDVLSGGDNVKRTQKAIEKFDVINSKRQESAVRTGVQQMETMMSIENKMREIRARCKGTPTMRDRTEMQILMQNLLYTRAHATRLNHANLVMMARMNKMQQHLNANMMTADMANAWKQLKPVISKMEKTHEVEEMDRILEDLANDSKSMADELLMMNTDEATRTAAVSHDTDALFESDRQNYLNGTFTDDVFDMSNLLPEARPTVSTTDLLSPNTDDTLDRAFNVSTTAFGKRPTYHKSTFIQDSMRGNDNKIVKDDDDDEKEEDGVLQNEKLIKMT